MFKKLLSLRSLSEENRTLIAKLLGLAIGVFAVSALVSTVSYFFNWKPDQSVLMGGELKDAVLNNGGTAGLRLAHLLVEQWFGMGALAAIVAFFLIAFRLVFGRRSFSVLRLVVLAITAAMISSFILALLSEAFGAQTAFGGGLGGRCGAEVIQWSEGLFGHIVTICFLIVFSIIWLLFASKKFARMFVGSGKSEEKPAEEKESRETVGIDEAMAELKKESVVEDAPVTEPVAPEVEPEEEAETPSEEETATPDDEVEVVVGEENSTEVVKDLPRIDVRDELKDFQFPPLTLLGEYENSVFKVPEQELQNNNLRIRAVLKTFKIDVVRVTAVVGSTVTLYKVYPAPGVTINAIKNRQDDIAMGLNAKGIRIVKLPDSVGIELANSTPSIVPLRGLLNSEAFRSSKAELPVAIGESIMRDVKIFDLTDAPHLLVAGATKQGKSVGLNVLITSLLYAKHPSELKFVFIDPKMVEFSSYGKLLNHYLAILPGSDAEDELKNAIAKTPDQAEKILKSLCIEMDMRYELLSKALVNKVSLYNEKYKERHLNPEHGHRYLPYIVVVVDEFADLTMCTGGSPEAKTKSRSISTSIIRLAQKGRAAGIHVVLATQRPSVDVVTGLIKSNFPLRIAFRVSSSVDSKTILDQPGAEKLIGRGDMIYSAGVENERVQCAFISGDEINTVNEFIAAQQGWRKSYNTPYYLPEPEEEGEEGTAMVDMQHLDERFEEAAELVVTSQKGSTSDIQRRLGMGYAKAGRVMDQLQAAGIVGPQLAPGKPREVLVASLEELRPIIEAFKNSSAS